MFPFTPRYLKHAKLMLKGVTRFLNYKRDLLAPAKLAEIEGLRGEFKDAMRKRDKAKLEDLSGKLNSVCETALPETQMSWIADNIEVIFVAIVIALGIRAYIGTLFVIPTGSMQPTLSGITAIATDADPRPGPWGTILGRIKGERYINVISDHEGELQEDDPRTEVDETLSEHRFLIMMAYCKLHFKDGHSITIGCPKRQLMDELHFGQNIQSAVIVTGNDTPDLRSEHMLQRPGYIQKGQILARGILRNGDQVLVNKVAYHFRAPKRGEVFVFTTNNISRIRVPEEQGSQHYIKRLAGVPGDKLRVQSPKLFINGREAEEPGFKRVMQGTRDAPVDGYKGYADARDINGYINEIELPAGKYFAMGDNSYNSSDSRYWGTVPDRNVVGPALWCYWPLNIHWGPIK